MERLKLRFFREAGVERWKVFGIASALPLLLQLAFLLFFIGLALFFHQLDPIVAWFTIGTGILWLGSLLFATFAPTFSAQCPYKTPFLKYAISRLRVVILDLPSVLIFWLWFNISWQWYPKLQSWIQKLASESLAWRYAWNALEEESISKNGSLSLPVISYTRNLLQGERLQDPIEECIRAISDDDIKKAEEGVQLESSPIQRMLPYIPDGPVMTVGSLLVEATEDSRLHSIYFGQEIRPCFYFALIRLQTKAYTPGSYVVPFRSLTAFICLIQANPTSAAFSFLTMYSIRHRTLTDHPGSFDDLFWGLSDSELHSHGIGKLTIPSPFPLQLIKHSQGTNSYRTYSQQQNPSSIPSGTNRKPSQMTGRLENVSKRFGPMLMSPILFARRTRLLSSMSLL